MSIVDAANKERDVLEIKRALEDIGCPVCDGDTIKDIPEIIRKKCHHGPQHVFNAIIEGGPGIKARLINGKGYKISANDHAELTSDLTPDLVAGTSIGKALFTIVNKLIPKAAYQGAMAPSIVDATFTKIDYTGSDSYVNRAYGKKGRGIKRDLRPNTWYLKVTLMSQIEPLYICVGELVQDIKNDMLRETHKLCGNMIERALEEYSRAYGFDFVPLKNRPCRPAGPHGHKHEHEHCPKHQHKPCPRPSDDVVLFPDELDPDFSVDPDWEVMFPDELDPNFDVMPEGPQVNFPENLDPGFGVIPEGPVVNVDPDKFVDVTVGGEEDDQIPEIRPGADGDHMTVDEISNFLKTLK